MPNIFPPNVVFHIIVERYLWRKSSPYWCQRIPVCLILCLNIHNKVYRTCSVYVQFYCCLIMTIVVGLTTSEHTQCTRTAAYFFLFLFLFDTGVPSVISFSISGGFSGVHGEQLLHFSEVCRLKKRRRRCTSDSLTLGPHVGLGTDPCCGNLGPLQSAQFLPRLDHFTAWRLG